MPSRSWNDIVTAVCEYEQLLKRIRDIIRIYDETEWLNVPHFSLIRVQQLLENCVIVELLDVPDLDNADYLNIKLADSIATLRPVAVIRIPDDDVDILDDEFLSEVREDYEKRVAERRRKKATRVGVVESQPATTFGDVVRTATMWLKNT